MAKTEAFGHPIFVDMCKNRLNSEGFFGLLGGENLKILSLWSK